MSRETTNEPKIPVTFRLSNEAIQAISVIAAKRQIRSRRIVPKQEMFEEAIADFIKKHLPEGVTEEKL